LRHFLLQKVRFNALQKQMFTHDFDIDWNQLASTKSLQCIVKINRYRSLCNSQQLTRKQSG
jgi:hypothetical protein